MLRYIHQNPVAGGLVHYVRDYRWSSWREYDARLRSDISICCTDAVHRKISFDALEELVDEPLPKTRRILDFDCDTGVRASDDYVREFIRLQVGISKISIIQHLEKEKRDEVLIMLLGYFRNVLQISRITGVSRGVLIRLQKNSTKGDGSVL